MPKPDNLFASHTMEELVPADILAVGSTVVDMSFTYDPPQGSSDPLRPVNGSSNPANFSQCSGGTAYNMALAAHYAGASVLLSTVVADDFLGDFLLREMERVGLSTAAVVKLSKETARTGTYTGNYDTSKSLIFGMADISLMEHSTFRDEGYWQSLITKVAPKWILLDTCFAPDIISLIVKSARMSKARIFVEPVSVPLSISLIKSYPGIINSTSIYPDCFFDAVAPNSLELTAMYESTSSNGLFDSCKYKKLMEQLTGANLKATLSKMSLPQNAQEAAFESVSLLPYFPAIITTLGENGCLLSKLSRREDTSTKENTAYLVQTHSSAPATVFVKHYPAPSLISKEDIVSVNGAGDTFNGVLIAESILTSQSRGDEAGFLDDACIRFAQEAAACSVMHAEAVSPNIRSLRR